MSHSVDPQCEDCRCERAGHRERPDAFCVRHGRYVPVRRGWRYVLEKAPLGEKVIGYWSDFDSLAFARRIAPGRWEDAVTGCSLRWPDAWTPAPLPPTSVPTRRARR